MELNVKYICIKTYEGSFGTFHAGKTYTRAAKLDVTEDIIYVYYHAEDMIDYNNSSKRKLIDVLPGMRFSFVKNKIKSSILKNDFYEYFGDYFIDVHQRKLKLDKINNTIT